MALLLNFMGSRFGSPVLVVKPEPNRTGKIFCFSNWFNRFFISVRFSRLIFHRFSRFFRLLGFFEHPYTHPHEFDRPLEWIIYIGNLDLKGQHTRQDSCDFIYLV